MSNARMTYHDLLAYAAGELSGPQAQAIEARIAQDPAAAATVDRYRLIHRAIQTDDGVNPPPEVIARAQAIYAPPRVEKPVSWWEQLEQVIATLIFDSRAQAALAGYRGGESGFEASFESGSATVDLQAQPADQSSDPESWHLMGQIDADEPTSGTPVALIDRDTGVPAAESTADEEGMFTLVAPSGAYDLYVGHGGRALVLRDIHMA